MPDAPTILVFDSGLGGLTVFREVKAARPDARYIYLADDAGFPYGHLDEDRLITRIVDVLGKSDRRTRARSGCRRLQYRFDARAWRIAQRNFPCPVCRHGAGDQARLRAICNASGSRFSARRQLSDVNIPVR